METQHQNNSVLSANIAIALQPSHLKNKTPVSKCSGNINNRSYNKANHTDVKTAASLWFCHRCLRRYALKK